MLSPKATWISCHIDLCTTYLTCLACLGSRSVCCNTRMLFIRVGRIVRVSVSIKEWGFVRSR